MKVILVDNLLLKNGKHVETFSLQPHLGLISLIAVLERAGHTAGLVDPKFEIASGKMRLDKQLYKNVARHILDLSPDAVGLTSLGCNFICTAKIAQYIREEMPGIPILLGGPHATVLHQQILERFPQFDLVVRNEAELKIVPALDALATGKFSEIPGITYREGSGVIANAGDNLIADLDELPFPAYHAYPIKALNTKSLRVEAGRGCPFQCTFCSTATYFGRRYRLKSVDKLCNEMEFLRTTYGITDFALTHDLFTVNRHKVMEFCEAVKPRGFKWTCSARMDCVDQDLLTNMKEAGCRSIYYGIETGSRRMQKISMKKLDLDIFHETLDVTYGLNMRPTISFITGYPQELKADQNDTLDLIGSCYHRYPEADINAQLHLLTPEPGTALLQEFKDEMDFDNHITDFNFPTLEDDDADIMRESKDVFMNHHYFRSQLPRSRNIFVTTFFQVLQPLGVTVIDQLLGLYDYKMSALFDAVEAWHSTREKYPDITAGCFRQFMKETFGKSSMTCSLVEFMYTLHELDHKPVIVPADKKAKGKKSFVVSPSITILPDIHNCPVIIEKLKARKKLSLRLQREKTNLLVQLFTDEEKNRMIRNFSVTKDVITLLDEIKAAENKKANLPIYRSLEEKGILQSC